MGDADKLARVFDNLLRNAVHYSPEGAKLAVSAQRDGAQVDVFFRNTGARIPQQQLERIFEKFYRLDSARSSRTGGAGLGLAIAKEIVELQRRHDRRIQQRRLYRVPRYPSGRAGCNPYNDIEKGAVQPMKYRTIGKAAVALLLAAALLFFRCGLRPAGADRPRNIFQLCRGAGTGGQPGGIRSGTRGPAGGRYRGDCRHHYL